MSDVSKISVPDYEVRASLFGGGCYIARPSWLGKYIKWFSGLKKQALIFKVLDLVKSPSQDGRGSGNLAQWATALKVLHGNDPEAQKAIRAAEDWFEKANIVSMPESRVPRNIRDRLVEQVSKGILGRILRGSILPQSIRELKQEYGKVYPIASEDIERAIDDAFNRAVRRTPLSNVDLRSTEQVERVIFEIEALKSQQLSKSEKIFVAKELGGLYHRIFFRINEAFSQKPPNVKETLVLLKLSFAVQRAINGQFPHGKEAKHVVKYHREVFPKDVGSWINLVGNELQSKMKEFPLDFAQIGSLISILYELRLGSQSFSVKDKQSVVKIFEPFSSVFHDVHDRVYMPLLQVTLEKWKALDSSSYSESKNVEQLNRMLGKLLLKNLVTDQEALLQEAVFNHLMGVPRTFTLTRNWKRESETVPTFALQYEHPRKKEIQVTLDSFPDSQAVVDSFAPRELHSIAINAQVQGVAELEKLNANEAQHRLVETCMFFERICQHCRDSGCTQDPSSMVGQLLSVMSIDYHPIAILKTYGSLHIAMQGTGNVTVSSSPSGIDKRFFFDPQKNSLVCEDTLMLVQVDGTGKPVKKWQFIRKVELSPDADIVKNGWTETISITPLETSQ